MAQPIAQPNSLSGAGWRAAERVAQRYSPAVISLATVLTLLIAIVSVRLIRAWWPDKPDSSAYRFDYAGPVPETPVARLPLARPALNGPPTNDPAARYAERLREAASLAIGLALTAFSERFQSRRFPASLAALVAAAEQRGLLPPGIKWDAAGQYFNGAAGRYWARYRTGSFGLEVLSAGWRGWADGEVFLLRLPDEAGQVLAPADSAPRASWAALWVANSPESLIPAPFAPAAQLPARGWRPESLRPGATNPARLADLLAWLKEAPAATGVP